ncbi:MAG: hypothetical protein AB9915_03465 [Candidatus Dojkabacteria bacterium]
MDATIESFNQRESVNYTEIDVCSFTHAVEVLKNENLSDSKFCLVDVDGTLIMDPLTKLPVVSHLVNPCVNGDIEVSFLELVKIFGEDNLSLVTNRNEKEKILWNSNKVLDSVRELLEKGGIQDSIVTSLNRQIPGLSKKKCNELLEKIFQYVDGNNLTIYSIEDASFVSPNRNAFLKYIGKKVSSEFGIGVNIVNYVIRT